MVPNDGGSKNMPPNYGNLGDHQKVQYSATVGWTEWSHVIIMCVHTETANRDSHFLDSSIFLGRVYDYDREL